MTDLIVRPSGRPAPKDYCLQLRFSHCGGTDYATITYISEDTARTIVEAGKPYWLFGDPLDQKDRATTALCLTCGDTRTIPAHGGYDMPCPACYAADAEDGLAMLGGSGRG